MGDPWDGYIPEETLEHYRRAGFGRPSAIGEAPALLVIDVQYMSCGETPMPLAEAISYHPMNCGEAGWKAIAQIQTLIAAFRRAGFPVIYPYAPRDQLPRKHSPMPFDKAPQAVGRYWDIVDEVAPQPGDALIPKMTASAFLMTPLEKYLNSRGVDTLFVVGNTTSGCIRATVIDGYSYDYKLIVAHDGCYDRSPVSHAVNLFDMGYKYADVVTTADAIAKLEGVAEKRSAAARVA